MNTIQKLVGKNEFNDPRLQLIFYANSCECQRRCTALQSQKVVTADFSSKKLLPSDSAEHYSTCGIDYEWEQLPLYLILYAN